MIRITIDSFPTGREVDRQILEVVHLQNDFFTGPGVYLVSSKERSTRIVASVRKEPILVIVARALTALCAQPLPRRKKEKVS